MFQGLSTTATKAMIRANWWSLHQGRDSIRPEYLLLGLMEENPSASTDILQHLGVRPSEALLKLKDALVIESATLEMPTILGNFLPRTQSAERVVEYAREMARILNHKRVGTDHLLFGLLRETYGCDAQFLTDLSLDIDEVHALLRGNDSSDPEDESTEQIVAKLKRDARRLLDLAEIVHIMGEH